MVRRLCLTCLTCLTRLTKWGAAICPKNKNFPRCDQREQPYPAFFEKEMGGSGGRGKTFFPVKKSFSSSPRFPSPLIHKPEHGFEQGRGVGRTAGDVEIGFEDFFDSAASFRGVCVNTA